MRRNFIYKNCISLGWFCGTASSMSLYGLRSYSGPFDWCFSDFNSVLKVIDNDFSDFMIRENLQLAEGKSKEFFDTKYGFYFNHDINENFQDEYPSIKEKYDRRTKRFLEATKKPTCFLRAVKSNKEISYIKENHNYIQRVIKKNNIHNEIIFLIPEYMDELPDDFLWFKLSIKEYIGNGYEMRTMFNSSKDFLKHCKTILSEEKTKHNMCYDLTPKTKDILISHLMEEKDDCIKDVILNSFGNVNLGIYIWGSGDKGIFSLQYLLDIGIKVNGIIDNDNKKVGTKINGIPVIRFSELRESNINIFIAIMSREAVESVLKQINDSKYTAKVVSYENLYELCPKLSWDYYRDI